MSDVYSELQSIASQLFTEFKQGTIAYVRSTPQAGATPDAPLPSILVSSALGGATARGVQSKYVIRGLAVASDLQVSFAGNALASEPKIDDFIDIDTERYKIVAIERKPAAGTPVAYTLIVRK